MKNSSVVILVFLLSINISFSQETVVDKTSLKRHVLGERTIIKHETRSSNFVYLSEDFESGTMPIGWTEQIGAATTGWTVGNDQSTQFWTIPDHTTYIAANDDACNCDMSDFTLYTPVIDLTSAVSPILKFDYYLANQYGCLTSVLLSIDGGSNYTSIIDLEGNQGWEAITINLSAAANQSNVKIAFHFNDQNEWTNGFVLDDVSVEDLPLIPNLEVKLEGVVNEYFSIPLDQASFSPKASIFNHTSVLNENVDCELSITGAYSDAQVLSIPFEYYTTQNIIFSPFSAHEEGIYTFEYNANYSADLDISNNIISKDIFLGGNELVRDNGIHKGNIGVNRENGELGNVFIINSKDTLTSVKFKMLNDENNNGNEVSVVVREFNTIPGEEIGHSVTVVNDGSAEYEAALQTPLILEAGKYYIGIQEGENNMRLEYTTTEYTDSTVWGFWTDEEGDEHPGESFWRYIGGGTYGFEHTYYIRPQFANVTNVSVKKLHNNTFTIYPNPASNYIMVESESIKIEGVQIIDITGKLVKQFDIQNYKSKIQISDLQKGIYFVKVGVLVNKFVKN